MLDSWLDWPIARATCTSPRDGATSDLGQLQLCLSLKGKRVPFYIGRANTRSNLNVLKSEAVCELDLRDAKGITFVNTCWKY